ncbi:MAG: exodeoxyribonuclease gamma subunit [Solirubrobacteraceae bacterium]|nr:exodeoxyribonuclease gamma subunit [Solirubrobacteraceae bacterium]
MPTRGMERWLTQRIADRLTICANVAFPSPRQLVNEAVAAASGIDPEADPWVPERAVWPLLDIVDGCMDEGWMKPLAQHLKEQQRRFAVVRHLAGLFDRYGLYRPELIQGWVDGDGDGWQPELWRRLRRAMGSPSPAERTHAAAQRLRDEPRLSELPPRVSLFGLTRLPQSHMRVLDALAAHRDVHLLLLHPSPALWEKVARTKKPKPRRRAGDETAMLPLNRLLASWGTDSRELQLVLDETTGERIDHHHEVEHPTASLLANLQRDIRQDRRPPGLPLPGKLDMRPHLDERDRSLEVHSCHGRARQVEVLKDALLHALEDDPTLEPRDVIVMCPDVETFAPLIQAVFGAPEIATEEDDDDPLPDELKPPDLRVRLADRSIRQTNPVLGVVAQLIDLAGKRLTASEVLDRASRDPVRRRFRFDDDDLARLEEWTGRTGIRWGLDREHRKPFRLDEVAEGTWRAGLDRVLVGVTMTEDRRRRYKTTLPYDDVDSGAIDLAGRFAEFIDRVDAMMETFAGAASPQQWAENLAEAADALTDTSPRDSWQRTALQYILHDLTDEAGEHDTPLQVAEVRALLQDRLQGRATRANFRTGHLTICTLMPMRSVPHRVVCLLGLDDGAFPRKSPRDGDDLLLDDPHVGDRDGRLEDRQLLLDALLAATDKLIITYAGRDERTNVEKPPAVPVGELLDLVDRTVHTQDGRPAREQLVTHHPLQPFDARNFHAPHPWSHDKITLDGAKALTSGEREAPAPFLPGPLTAPQSQVIELDDLVRFVGHPVKAFLRQRLGISVGRYDDEPGDALPVALDGLERWAIGERLLEGRLAGIEQRETILAERARGLLPPGFLGFPVVSEISGQVEALVTAAHAIVPPTTEAASLDVRVTLPDGRVLAGTVPGVAGDCLREATFSRLAAKHRLTSWVRFLALTTAHPDHAFTAATIGRAGREGVRVARLPRMDPEIARQHLAELVDLRDRGLREPLPIACKTSAAYVEAIERGEDPADGAASEWTSAWNFDREDRDDAHLLVWGELTVQELLQQPPTAEEAAWEPGERSRFGIYARRLWVPLIGAEQ